jgi:hypothetical protein
MKSARRVTSSRSPIDACAGRAEELRRLGHDDRADAVANCECMGSDPEELHGQGACERRECPRCGRCYVLILRRQIEDRIRRMDGFSIVRLEVPFDGTVTLPAAWEDFRAALRQMRWFTLPVQVIGITFADVFGDGPHALRADIVIGQEECFIRRLRKMWRRYTGGRGVVRPLLLRNTTAPAIAREMTPPGRWLPSPGIAPLALLEDYFIAMKHRWWKVDWRNPTRRSER